MSDTICPNCSNPLQEGAKFCTSCGRPVEAEPSPPPPPPVPAPTDAPEPPPAPEPPSVPEAPATTESPSIPDTSPPSGSPVVPESQGGPTQPPPPPGPSTPPPPAPWASEPTGRFQQTPPTQAVPSQQPPATGDWGAAPAAPGQYQQPTGAHQMPPTQTPAPAPAKSKGRANPLGALLGLVGGIVAIVSVFLDWFVHKTPDGETARSFFDLFNPGDGALLDSPDAIFVIIAGAVAVIVAGIVLATRSKGLAALLLLAGVAVIGIAIYDWMQVSDIAEGLTTDQSIAGGIGLYLAWAAGGVIILGGVLGIALGKKQPVRGAN